MNKSEIGGALNQQPHAPLSYPSCSGEFSFSFCAVSPQVNHKFGGYIFYKISDKLWSCAQFIYSQVPPAWAKRPDEGHFLISEQERFAIESFGSWILQAEIFNHTKWSSRCGNGVVSVVHAGFRSRDLRRPERRPYVN